MQLFLVLSAYKVTSVLDLEVIILVSSKYKKPLSIIEYYYSYHIYELLMIVFEEWRGTIPEEWHDVREFIGLQKNNK